jgi:hypothetical protein
VRFGEAGVRTASSNGKPSHDDRLTSFDLPPCEPRLAHLIGELWLAGPNFRTCWAERHVNYTAFGTGTYTHAVTGPYTLDRQILFFLGNNQLLMVLTAATPKVSTPSVDSLPLTLPGLQRRRS